MVFWSIVVSMISGATEVVSFGLSAPLNCQFWMLDIGRDRDLNFHLGRDRNGIEIFT